MEDGASGIREPSNESERSDMATASGVDAANDGKGAARRGRGAFSMHTLGHLEDRHLPVVATATSNSSRKSESASLRGPHQSAESLTLDPCLPATTTVTCSCDIFHSPNVQSHTLHPPDQTSTSSNFFTSNLPRCNPASCNPLVHSPSAFHQSGEWRGSRQWRGSACGLGATVTSFDDPISPCSNSISLHPLSTPYPVLATSTPMTAAR